MILNWKKRDYTSELIAFNLKNPIVQDFRKDHLKPDDQIFKSLIDYLNKNYNLPRGDNGYYRVKLKYFENKTLYLISLQPEFVIKHISVDFINDNKENDLVKSTLEKINLGKNIDSESNLNQKKGKKVENENNNDTDTETKEREIILENIILNLNNNDYANNTNAEIQALIKNMVNSNKDIKTNISQKNDFEKKVEPPNNPTGRKKKNLTRVSSALLIIATAGIVTTLLIGFEAVATLVAFIASCVLAVVGIGLLIYRSCLKNPPGSPTYPINNINNIDEEKNILHQSKEKEEKKEPGLNKVIKNGKEP